HLDGHVYLRRPIQIQTILLGQNFQGRLAHGSRLWANRRRRVADEDSIPQAEWVGDEIAIPSVEDIILPSVGQGRVQRIATRPWENIGGKKIGDLLSLCASSIGCESARHYHAEDVVVKGIALVIETTSR